MDGGVDVLGGLERVEFPVVVVFVVTTPPLTPPLALPPPLSALTLDRCIHLPLTPSTALKNPVEPALNVR